MRWLGKIPRVAPQHVETLVEPREQCARRKESRARRRELDRQRHPIEAPADTGDGRRVLGGECEVGMHRLCALHEQPYGIAGLGEPFGGGHLLRRRDGERRHRELVLPADA